VILIVLKAKIRPEKRDEWLAGIKRYTADVRREPGNVSFDYYENGENPDEFAIIETFADGDAGSAHVATEHAKNFFAWMPAMITERPKINYQDLDGEAWSEMAEVAPE
jgi:quinol monooxygenase YgiN